VATTETAAVPTGRGVPSSVLREDRLLGKLDEEDQEDDRREGTKATHKQIINPITVQAAKIS